MPPFSRPSAPAFPFHPSNSVSGGGGGVTPTVSGSGGGTSPATVGDIISDVRPEWFGALADGVHDDSDAINAAIASLTNSIAVGGGRVRLSSTGNKAYKCNKPWAWTTGSITIEGMGYSGTPGLKPTTVDFTDLPDNQYGIDVLGVGATTLGGTTLRKFFIYGGLAHVGGSAVRVRNASLCEFDLIVDWRRGATSCGLQLSDSVTLAYAVIASEVKGLYVCDGTPVFIGSGCTSIRSKTYTIGHGVAGVVMKGCTYIEVDNCASDTGGANAYAYKCDGASNITFICPGAEGNGKALLLITGGSTSITLISPRGVNNNSSADATIGSLVEIAAVGVNYDITIIDPRDTNPNAATPFSIRGGAGNGWTRIFGGNPTALPKGIGGDATWLGGFVTILDGALLQVPVLKPAYRVATELEVTTALDARFGSLRVTLTAARLVMAPANPVAGQRMVFTFIQGGAGGFAVTWNAVFKVVWSNVGNAAGTRSSVEFEYDGVNWNQVSAQAPWV